MMQEMDNAKSEMEGLASLAQVQKRNVEKLMIIYDNRSTVSAKKQVSVVLLDRNQKHYLVQECKLNQLSDSELTQIEDTKNQAQAN